MNVCDFFRVDLVEKESFFLLEELKILTKISTLTLKSSLENSGKILIFS